MSSNTSSVTTTPAEVLEQSQMDLISVTNDLSRIINNDPLTVQPLLPDDITWVMMMDLSTSPVRHLSLDRGRLQDTSFSHHRRYTMPADLSTMFDQANLQSAPLATPEIGSLTMPPYDASMFVSALPSPPFMDTSTTSSLQSSLVPSLQSSKTPSLASSPQSTPMPTPKQQGRRKSSHSSVAAAVALTAHEPTTRLINGIEHLTFMYSHDRHVKQYTIRIDIENVSLDDIDDDFRQASAVYPRANVPPHQYGGNRWEYETSCNQLGWKLAHKNAETLFGRRGLIQRAVDSYRNRHQELRSRRVTRQEKIANGTLRKRQAKKRNQRYAAYPKTSQQADNTGVKPKTFSETVTVEHPTKGSHHRICFVISDIPNSKSSKERYKMYDQDDTDHTAQYREWCNEVSWRLVVKNPCLAKDRQLLERAVNECIRRKSPSELQQLSQTQTSIEPLLFKSHFDANVQPLDRYPPYMVQQS